MFQKWMAFPVWEGFAKTASRVLQKAVGIHSAGFVGSLVATFTIGIVQMFGGLVGGIYRKQRFFPSPPQVLAAVVFAFFATVSTVLGIYSFTYPGADVGITTFLISISVVPAAILDRVFFGDTMRPRQIFGIAVFILGGWAMFDFPGFGQLLDFPIWAVLTLVITVLSAVNQAITRGVSLQKIADPFVWNFWIGFGTVFFTTFALVSLVGGSPIFLSFSASFWIGTIAIGAIVVAMVSFQLLAFIDPRATVAMKTLIMQSVYLSSAVLFGWVVHQEPLTLGKLVGVTLFVLAFLLSDKSGDAFRGLKVFVGFKESKV